ncbi:hypothetical protein [Nocardioides pyridinolyticus]
MSQGRRRDDVREIEGAKRVSVGCDDHERHVLGLPGGWSDAVGTDGERDRLDLFRAVGFEDLVQRANGDLVDRCCVTVLLRFRGQLGGCDLVLRLDVAVLLDRRQGRGLRDVDLQGEFAAGEVEAVLVFDGEGVRVDGVREDDADVVLDGVLDVEGQVVDELGQFLVLGRSVGFALRALGPVGGFGLPELLEPLGFGLFGLL